MLSKQNYSGEGILSKFNLLYVIINLLLRKANAPASRTTD